MSADEDLVACFKGGRPSFSQQTARSTGNEIALEEAKSKVLPRQSSIPLCGYTTKGRFNLELSQVASQVNLADELFPRFAGKSARTPYESCNPSLRSEKSETEDSQPYFDASLARNSDMETNVYSRKLAQIKHLVIR